MFINIRGLLPALVCCMLSLPSTQAAHAQPTSPVDSIFHILNLTQQVLDGRAGFRFSPLPRTVRHLTEDFAALMQPRALGAQRALGSGTVEFGIGLEYTQLAHAGDWQATTGKTDHDAGIPRLHVKLGLPEDFNLRASLSRNAAHDVTLIGFDLTKQLLPETGILPALGINLSTVHLRGVTSLQLRTMGADLVASKQFGMFTPYAGIGHTLARGRYDSPRVVPFDMNATLIRTYLGTEIGWGNVVLAAEYGNRQGAQSTSLNLAYRF